MISIKTNLKKLILFTLEFCIVATAILITIYIITGGFTYSHIKISGTCVEIHKLWRPLLTILILIGIVQFLKYIWDLKTRPQVLKNPIYHLIVMLVLYNAFVIPFVLFRYYSFKFKSPDDFAIFNQAIFNTVHGDPLATTCPGYIYKNWNLLADHFSFLPLLLAPIYYFFQDASTLLVIQVLVISLGAIPIYFISIGRLKNKWLGLSISAVYLLYPLITKSCFSEPRQDYFIMLFLLFAFWSLENQSRWLLLVFISLTLLCKENAFIYTFFLGFYIIFKKNFKRHICIGMLIILFSALWGILSWKYFMPYFREYAGEGVTAYDWYNIGSVLNNPFSLHDVWTCGNRVFLSFVDFTKTLGCIPLFSPVLVLGIASFMENAFGVFAYGPDYVKCIWHYAAFIPFLFTAYIFAINNLLIFGKRFLRHVKSYRYYILVYAIGLPLLTGGSDFITNIIVPFISNKLAISFKPDLYNSFDKVYKYIPRKGSLVGTFLASPNLSSRKEFLIQGYCKIEKPDYIFLSPIIELPWEKELFDKLLGTGKYDNFSSNEKFTLYCHQDNLIKMKGPEFQFPDKEIMSEWEINYSQVKYKYTNGLGGLYIDTYLDGDGNEDEFVQIRKRLSTGISVNQYPYFEIVFKIEDPAVQFIQVVLGVDIDEDGEIDHFLSLYKEDVTPKIFNRYRLNIYELLKEEYPNKENFTIYHIEFYPHKKWYLDCTEKHKKGWYKFWIKELKFFNLVLKEK